MSNVVLEGLESSWDSPGLGEVVGTFEQAPQIGKRFKFNADHYPDSILTGRVKRVRDFKDGTIGFQTNRTTYLLKPSAGASGE